MRKFISVAIGVFSLLGATAVVAQQAPELNDGKSNIHKFGVRGYAKPGGGSAQNLLDRGGPVMTAPKVVCIFWGFGANGDSYTAAMQNFRDNGINNYIRMLPQYRNAGGNAPANMGGRANDKFDTSPVPQAVSDADVQGAVKRNFPNPDPNTIYEVFIPSTSYSQDGLDTSCGGPNLQYCAYHGHFSFAGVDVKYSIEPYPSCSGCHTSGFNINQDANHFAIHETREAITDPDINAWLDRRGYEADDKCAWSPTPFIDQATGFAYQYEWSNAVGGCVKQ